MAGELIVKHGLRVSGSTIMSGSLTATSFTGSFSGSITSASYAATASIASTASFFSGSISNATSASFASTASLAPLYTLVSATSSMLAPYLLVTNTSSFLVNSQTGSFVLNSFTASMLAPYMLVANTGSMLSLYTPNSQTGSFVRNSQTSSFVQNSQTSSFVSSSQLNSYLLVSNTSSFVVNSQTGSFVTNSQTGSFVVNSQTGSFVLNSFTSSMLAPYLLVANTSSFATTTQLNSYLLLSNTSSMLAPYLPTGLTGSFAKQNASNSFVGTQVITGSLFVTGSGISGSFSGSFIGDGSGLSGVAASFPITPGVVNASTQYFVSNTSVSQYITHTQVANILAGNGLISNGTALLVNSSSFSGSFLLISSTGSMLAPYLLVANTSSFAATSQLASYLLISNTASMIAPYMLISNTGSMLSPYTPNSQTGSFIRNNQTSSFYTGSFTGSFIGTSSFAATASRVNTLNQNVIITGSLAIATGSIGSGESALVVGPAPAGGTGEGGQIALLATGGTYTSSSFLDTYQDQFRIIKGPGSTSNAGILSINLQTANAKFEGAITASAYDGLPNDYLYATLNANQTIPAGTWANVDIIFDNLVVVKGIPYNPVAGTATLTGGKVYRITARLAWNAAATYLFQYSCYDSANIQIGPTVEIVQSTNGSNNISDGTLDFIYVPSINTDVKIRTTNNTTALPGEFIRSDLNTQFIIQQIA